MSYLGPAQTMESYGMKSDAFTDAIVRGSGAWQMCAAATMVLDEETILDKAFIPVIAAMLLYIPGITEVKGGIPKEPLVAWLGVHVVLAKLAASGKVNKWVAPALYFFNGAQAYFAPAQTFKLYGGPALSKEGVHVTRVWGTAMLCTAAYLSALANGDGARKGVGYAYLVAAGTVIRSFVFDTDLGVSRPMLAAWIVACLGIAYLGLN